MQLLLGLSNKQKTRCEQKSITARGLRTCGPQVSMSDNLTRMCETEGAVYGRKSSLDFEYIFIWKLIYAPQSCHLCPTNTPCYTMGMEANTNPFRYRHLFKNMTFADRTGVAVRLETWLRQVKDSYLGELIRLVVVFQDFRGHDAPKQNRQQQSHRQKWNYRKPPSKPFSTSSRQRQ